MCVRACVPACVHALQCTTVDSSPVPEDHADTVDLSKKDVKLRNTISPNPEPIEAQTTPKMTTDSMWKVATKMKLASEAMTHTETRILYIKCVEGEGEGEGEAIRRRRGRVKYCCMYSTVRIAQRIVLETTRCVEYKVVSA